MKRKELIVTIKISLGEVPDNKTLRETGITLQEYANNLMEDVIIASRVSGPIDIEDEIKVSTRVIDME